MATQKVPFLYTHRLLDNICEMIPLYVSNLKKFHIDMNLSGQYICLMTERDVRKETPEDYCEKLDISKTSELAPYAESVFKFAEKEALDPQWLASVVLRFCLEAKKFAPERNGFSKPTEDSSAKDFADYAIRLVQIGGPSRHHPWFKVIKESFDKANQKALLEEATLDPTQHDARYSATYAYLSSFTGVLNEIRHKSFMDNY